MYSQLRACIDALPIVDDHSHPGYAQVCAELGMGNSPVRYLSPTASAALDAGRGYDWQRLMHREAYRLIYGLEGDLEDPDRLPELDAIFQQKRQDPGALVDACLHAAGVEYAMGNLFLPHALEHKPNLGLVPTVDPLIFPFGTAEDGSDPLKNYTPVLQRYKKAYGCPDSPGFEDYMAFVGRALAGLRRDGCDGYKLLLAYLRSLRFDEVSRAEAADAYRAAQGGDLSAYKALQDYIAWAIFTYASAQGIPVQIHTALIDGRIGDFSVFNLQNLLCHQATRAIKLVLLHCAYPRYGDAATLALAATDDSGALNQVHLEFSGRILYMNHPRVVARMLREYLDFPLLWDKLIYGSDAWYGERWYYTCARTGREAVYLALSDMIGEEIIDEDTAIQIAKNILRNNAIRLYGLPLQIL